MDGYFERSRFSFSQRQAGRFFKEEGRTQVSLRRKTLKDSTSEKLVSRASQGIGEDKSLIPSGEI